MPSTDRYSVTIKPLPGAVTQGDVVRLEAEPSITTNVRFVWDVKGFGKLDKTDQDVVHWSTAGLAVGTYPVQVTGIWDLGGGKTVSHTVDVPVDLQGRAIAAPTSIPAGLTMGPAALAPAGPIAVTLMRSDVRPTTDLALWILIRKATEALGFNNYRRFMDILLCGQPRPPQNSTSFPQAQFDAFDQEFTDLSKRRFLPYTDSDAYRMLKVATEAFVMSNCAVSLRDTQFSRFDVDSINQRMGTNLTEAELDTLWVDYLVDLNGHADATIPYLELVRDKLGDSPLINDLLGGTVPPAQRNRSCVGIIRSKLTHPCMLELIYSYWLEEGMLVQTMNAVAMRFQNVRSPGEQDPLRMMEIDPLRPLNNLLWGWIQDEQHRLTMVRRALEYEHAYGIRLYGRAVPPLRPADVRSKFLEAFHNLLYIASVFYKSDDATTVVADGFPVLNALKEVHLLLSESAHNQYGDLPTTSRIENLMQQWILARPEFREFLPTRTMTALPERWMDRVDAMKTLQRWTDTSVLQFRNLATAGEQLLLSIRFGNWADVNEPGQGANWARFWRSQVQSYIHAYRSATGVDLTSDPVISKDSESRYAQPWVHLKSRLETQTQRRV
ncbi:MAG TPA: hypothetical protein VEX68_14925 [Bryobacteraceae bacterium]|nr:hypothetical protein [Bryobacteraceae bacterium]